MATKKKMLQAAAGNAGGEALNVEDVFSTYLYDGVSSALTITNGIDLAGEGGLVWTKRRGPDVRSHILFDSERGASARLMSDSTAAEASQPYSITYNSDGYSWSGADNDVTIAGSDYASWTFRKAPKFFDVVTYTGDRTSGGQSISHSLGAEPAVIIIKRTDSSESWIVYHKDLDTAGGSYKAKLELDSTGAAFGGTQLWSASSGNVDDHTTTTFYVGDHNSVNATGGSFVAYLFAHNDGDGGFNGGDIIKCGSYTTDGSEEATIDLGFEPQWLLVKRTDATGGSDWRIIDSMRGWEADGDAAYVEPNTSDAEAQTGDGRYYLTSTGFKQDNFGANRDYIYIAIRRGTKVPESGTEVFDVASAVSPAPTFDTSFAVDMGIRRGNVNGSGDNVIVSRLTGSNTLETNTNAAEGTNSGLGQFDFMDGWASDGGTSETKYGWMWKRAPNFFDVVAYTGDGSTVNINHNLGAAPEMIWVKRRNSSDANAAFWSVYHKDLGYDKVLKLNDAASTITYSGFWGSAHTDTTFGASTSFNPVNTSGNTYIAYLFASLDGVSKVGSFTGTGGSGQTIDCGFTSGARFVLIKRTDSTTYGDWYVWDSERGIVSGNDSRLSLNTTSAEVSADTIDPHSSGFSTVASTIVDQSGATYIFYAIA